MGKPKYDPPTTTYPYKISRRLNSLSVPKKVFFNADIMPALTPRGIRVSALNSRLSDRVHDAAWPTTRRFVYLKRMYKHTLSQQRLEKIDRMLEASNATIYSKLANCVLDLKKADTKDVRKKKGWSESEWKKHMDYINQIAGPKKDFTPPPLKRGPAKPLEDIMQRVKHLCWLPDYKVYKRLSKEEWYRDPTKVQPSALKYVISDRVKKLATPRAMPEAT